MPRKTRPANGKLRNLFLKFWGLQTAACGYDQSVRVLAATALVLAGLVGATASPAASSMSARAATHCRDVGPPGTDTGLYSVVASHISCKSARRVLTRWYNDASAPDSGPRGWHCRRHASGEISFRTRCSNKHARIAFTQFSA